MLRNELQSEKSRTEQSLSLNVRNHSKKFQLKKQNKPKKRKKPKALTHLGLSRSRAPLRPALP